MAPEPAPPEVRALADARSEARRARDWATADRLKAEIEAAGWKVVDAASLYTLEPLAPPDVEVDGRVRYGSSSSVPSRLEETPVGIASVVIVASTDVDAVVHQVGLLADSAPDGTQAVVVANAPSGEAADALATLDARDPGAPGVATDVVSTATRLGAAAAWNVGIRRSAAPVVILVAEGVTVPGALVGAIVDALGDESVAVAGPVGLITDDLRTFRRAPSDATDVDAIARDTIGFRRADVAVRGLLDEHFVTPDFLDAWWSLVLRDPPAGDDDDEDGDEPRRAVQVPFEVTRAAASGSVAGGDGARQAKRNFYRFLKRFATRRDLLTSVPRREA